MQEVQEPQQQSSCVNKEGVLEDINTETKDQRITEEKQEKTDLLSERTTCQLLQRNKDFYGKSFAKKCFFSKQRKI
jgi:hypothetical protein